MTGGTTGRAESCKAASRRREMPTAPQGGDHVTRADDQLPSDGNRVPAAHECRERNRCALRHPDREDLRACHGGAAARGRAEARRATPSGGVTAWSLSYASPVQVSPTCLKVKP